MSIGKIAEFNTKDGVWSSYVDRLDMYFKVNNIKEDLKVPTMISVMGDEAYELLVTLSSPRKPSELSYPEAVGYLRHHLQPCPSVLAERYRFRQRRQRQEEKVADYVAELKKLSRNCKFGEKLNENLRDQFVCGLKGDVTRQRLFAEDENLEFTNAVKIATSLEAAERDAAAVEIRVGAETAGSVGEVHSMQAGMMRTARSRQQRGRGGRGAQRGVINSEQVGAFGNCKGCGATSHDYGNCRFREYVCSRCGRRGHLRRVCLAAEGAGNSGAVAPTKPSRNNGGGGGGNRGARTIHYSAPDRSELSEQESVEESIDLHQLCLREYQPI